VVGDTLSELLCQNPLGGAKNKILVSDSQREYVHTGNTPFKLKYLNGA
jgi:hypothetical protein